MTRWLNWGRKKVGLAPAGAVISGADSSDHVEAPQPQRLPDHCGNLIHLVQPAV
jgi:hypothetical protein